MKSKRIIQTSPLFALAALLLPVALWAGTVQISEIRPAESDGTVEIESISGTITITGWNRSEVEVKGEMDDEGTLHFEGTRNRTTIEVEWPDSRSLFGHRHNNFECDLEIRVPFGSSIQVEGVSAEITVSGVNGEMELESVSGSIKVETESSEVSAESVSGNVMVSAGSGLMEVSSVSGNVRLMMESGEASAASVSGNVTVEGDKLKDVEIESVSGNCYFTGELGPQARVDISSHSGNVEVTLKGKVSARFEVDTFSGDIESDFGGEAEKTSRFVPSKEFSHTVGGGDARVVISCFSGEVRLIQS